MRSSLASFIVLSLFGASCGGRALGDPHTGGADAAAGATGTAGTTGVAGAAGQGGAGGGVVACGPCPDVVCKPGFTLQKNAISCCLVCQPIDCSTVECVAPQCAADGHVETPMGQCCPVCLPGQLSVACQNGLRSYQLLRQELLDKYNSQGCLKDNDCALVTESNRCALGCGLAFSASLAMNAVSNLDGAAQMDCGTCPLPFAPPCEPVVAICSNQRCTTGAPR